MEQWLANGNENLRGLITVGFLETLQNAASWQTFGRETFIPFLGPQCRQAWNEIEKIWAGKTSFMEVIRAEGNKPSSWRKIPISLIFAALWEFQMKLSRLQ